MRKLALCSVALGTAAMACVAATAATAQTRQQTPRAAPMVKAPIVDPVTQRLNAMQAKLEALEESAGKQVVVLHFTPSELPGWPDNNAPSNQQRSSDLCEQALAERYGRVISYRTWTNGDNYFFTHVVCETRL